MLVRRILCASITHEGLAQRAPASLQLPPPGDAPHRGQARSHPGLGGTYSRTNGQPALDGKALKGYTPQEFVISVFVRWVLAPTVRNDALIGLMMGRAGHAA